MSIVDTIDGLIRDISDLVGAGVSRLCDIETVINEHSTVKDGKSEPELIQEIFSLKDGSLATMIRVRGHRLLVGHDEFVSGLSGLVTGLTGLLKNEGRSLIVHYRYDPFDKSAIERSVAGMKLTAKNAQLDLDDVIDDWGDAVGRYTRGESMMIIAVTRTDILARGLRKEAKKETLDKDRANPFKAEFIDTQRIAHFADVMIDQHKAYVNSIMDTLASPTVSIVAEKVGAREALRIMRSQVSPNETGKEWSPSLPGDRLHPRMKDTTRGLIADNPVYRPIGHQLFTPDRSMINSTTVRWGDTYHRAMSLIPPLGDTSFSRLFERATSPDYAWNLSFHINGGGMDVIWLKSLAATFLLPLSPINRQIHRAEKWLRELSEVGNEAIVGLRMTLRVESKSLSMLDRATSEMIATLQSWQSCEAIIPMGTAQAMACASTVPGLLSRSPSPVCGAPLRDVITLLPWTRPAEIWDYGMPFRTGDGRAFPWLQGSSQQASFIDIGLGPMGSGKSVNLGSINIGFILNPGMTRIPMLSQVDIGPSSLGMITTIQDALPEHLKHLATYVRLRMDVNYSINVFDLPIGAEYPFPAHEFFLVNFLVLLQTPLGSSTDRPRPPEYAAALSRAIIKKAYDHCSRKISPKLYKPGQDPGAKDCAHVDFVIREMNIPVDAATSWYDIVDELFSRNMIREAEIAQRYAVPTLGEVLSFSNDSSIRQIYGDEGCHVFGRVGMNAILDYPIINKATRFSIADARIVSLDLDEVAIKGSPMADRQCGVVFMLVRHLLISRFFVQDEDIDRVPGRFREYHRKRVGEMRRDPKRIVFDEVHRFIKDDNPVVSEQVLSDVNTVSRESRKWNIHIGLYTQEPADIPADLAGLATTVFVMGVNGSESMAKRADDLFSFGGTARTAMLQRLRKPGRSGSHMIARMVVDGLPVVRYLQNTLGPILMWSLSSTSEDSWVRNRLYKIYGGRVTRKAMALMYPGGTIKDLFEKMREARGEGRYLTNDDRDIYEHLERTATEPVDPLEVIQVKVERFIENKRISEPGEWT